jgi:hypothetical protein
MSESILMVMGNRKVFVDTYDIIERHGGSSEET